jgi:hypothetical protein
MRRIQQNTCTIISEDTPTSASSTALATLSPTAAAIKTYFDLISGSISGPMHRRGSPSPVILSAGPFIPSRKNNI